MTPISATQGTTQQNDADALVTKAKDDSLANKEAFLEMLIAQLQNQDPLNPADGVQFLTQLSQFSQLEQTMGIRDDLRNLHAALVANSAAEGQSNA